MAKFKKQLPGQERPMSNYYSKYLNTEMLKKLIFDPHYLNVTCNLLLLFEILINVLIIEKVKYTEIDWTAYMQEVEGFVNGTWNYKYLKGDTGPLVYPAGFVYIYTVLYYITSKGSNIRMAQYVFLLVYISQLYLSFRIYKKTAKVSPYALIICTLTSYRIHSIYVLRLFNDPFAVLLFYLSLSLFLENKWLWGSVLYSLAVSVKMNILLYSPCLLIAYLTNLTLKETCLNLCICAFVQLVLGAPFICSNIWSYIKSSFDLGRVFEHKWTVNYRFLDRSIFEARYFHLILLAIHVLLLLAFLPLVKQYLCSYNKLNGHVRLFSVKDAQKSKQVTVTKNKTSAEDRIYRKQKQQEQLNRKQREFLSNFEKQLKSKEENVTGAEICNQSQVYANTIAQLFVLPFFLTNLIGVVCARSLHYQFYSWYFHSLLYLAHCSGYSKPIIFLMLAVIEYSWNVYPSTNISSLLLHVCHCLLLFGIYRYMLRSCSYLKQSRETDK